MMFEKSPQFYDAIYSFKDYETEAEELHAIIQQHRPSARSLLDVACGTGRHIELMRDRYEIEGVDIDANLLEIAAARNPGIPMHAADMITLDLGRSFDVVMCLFSSIGYVETVPNLMRTTASLARHVTPGGLLLIEPWLTPEIFTEGHIGLVTVEEEEIKVARMNVAGLADGVTVLDLHYLVGTAQGVEHFVETHRLGLFGDDQYRDAITTAGLELKEEAHDLTGRGLYVATRPG